jgi:hypothetical protein
VHTIIWAYLSRDIILGQGLSMCYIASVSTGDPSYVVGEFCSQNRGIHRLSDYHPFYEYSTILLDLTN